MQEYSTQKISLSCWRGSRQKRKLGQRCEENGNVSTLFRFSHFQLVFNSTESQKGVISTLTYRVNNLLVLTMLYLTCFLHKYFKDQRQYITLLSSDIALNNHIHNVLLYNVCREDVLTLNTVLIPFLRSPHHSRFCLSLHCM